MSFTNRTLFNILTIDRVLKPGRALELGCGHGKDAAALAQSGHSVDAVDMNPEAVAFLPASSAISFSLSRIEDFKIAESAYNLISCQYVLHFLPKETANEMIARMARGSAPGGAISFNLLGEKDEWRDTWTTWKRGEADDFLKTLPVAIHKTITEEGMGMTRAGTLKYWHVLNYVLIRK